MGFGEVICSKTEEKLGNRKCNWKFGIVAQQYP